MDGTLNISPLSLSAQVEPEAPVAASFDTSRSLAQALDEQGLPVEFPEQLPHTVFYTTPFQPFAVDATRFLSLSLEPNDELLRIASTTREMSTGQFGQWPIVAFGKRSVWAITTDENGIPVRSAPVAHMHGLYAEHGVAGIDGGLAFVSQDGIWLLTSGLEERPISRGIVDVTGAVGLQLNPEAHLSAQDIYGQPALVYCDGSDKVWIYWLALGGWTTAGRIAQQVFEYGGRLHYLEGNALIRRWQASPEADQYVYPDSWSLLTAPFGGEMPEQWKRVWWASVRARMRSGGMTFELLADGQPALFAALDTTSSDTLGTAIPSARYLQIRLSSFALLSFGNPPTPAADLDLEGFDVVFEPRYLHRPYVGKLS